VIDPAVGNPAKHQARFGLGAAVDAGPEVLRIGLPQILQIYVDGVSVDIDQPCAGGSVSVDGQAPYNTLDGVNCTRG
jgi:hypothetical protein